MLSIIDDQGVERFLGNLEPPTGLTKAWPVYGDQADTPMIPRSQWDSLLTAEHDKPDDPFLPYVHDQDGIGQCNCDATAALIECVRAIQGLPFVKLSAADLYDRINGGGDNGSMLEDAMHEMLTSGIGTAATAGTLWRRGMHTAPADERARFKAIEVFTAPTFDHFFSGLLSGFRGVSGVMWYSNFTPDGAGWLPAQGRGRPGGHAVLGYKATKRNSAYGVWHQNSWTPTWGLAGRCVFPETIYGRSIGGLWLCRVVTDEGGVVPNP